jgi:hypothetical protein
MTEYKIVTARYLPNLVTAVNEACGDGWEPVGAPWERAVGCYGNECVQAMVRQMPMVGVSGEGVKEGMQGKPSGGTPPAMVLPDGRQTYARPDGLVGITEPKGKGGRPKGSRNRPKA